MPFVSFVLGRGRPRGRSECGPGCDSLEGPYLKSKPREQRTLSIADQFLRPQDESLIAFTVGAARWVAALLVGLAGAFVFSYATLATASAAVHYAGVGVLVWIVAGWLLAGSRASRFLVGVVAVAGAAVGVCVLLRGPLPTRLLDAGLLLALSLILLLLLWIGRREFRTWWGARAQAAGGLGLLAALIVLAFGAGWIWYLHEDAEWEPHEDLAPLGVLAVPERDLYARVQELRERSPDRLATMEGLRSMPTGGRFAVPRPEDYAGHQPAPWQPWLRAAAGALADQAEADLAAGRIRAARDSADALALIGLALCRDHATRPGYLTGLDVCAHRLRLARLEGAATDDPERVRALMEQIGAAEDVLAEGCRRALGVSLDEIDLLVDACKAQGVGQVTGEDYGPLALWDLPGLRDLLPLAKANRTHNIAGEFLMELVPITRGYFDPAALWRRGPLGFRVPTPLMDSVHVALNPAGDLLVVGWAPAPSQMVARYWERVTELRLTELFLALRLYHLERGALPESLAGARDVGLRAVPRDPYTDDWFIYRAQAEPPEIVSAGPDRAAAEPGEERGDDIALTLDFAAGRGEE